MMRSSLLFAYVTLLLTCPAMAQTAEETALFMAFGLEDRLKDKDGNMVARQTSKNAWELLQGRPEEKTILVTQLNSCTYQFSFGQNKMVFDFGKVREIDVRSNGRGGIVVVISGPEIVTLNQNGQTKLSDQHVQHHDMSADRYNKALTYFRTTFCKGRAF